MRRTKIIATIGPASVDPAVLRELIYAGVDVFRLNFSHGTHESHRAAAEAIREAGSECGRDVSILQDLCGPKIRCGEIENNAVELIAGQETCITTSTVVGTATRFSCTYKGLTKDAVPGHRILLNDGLMELEVLAVAGDDVRCRVVCGGTLSSHKGINLPGMELSTPSVTAKDMKDLAAGVDIGVDFVALSFVRQAEDVLKVRRAVEKRDNPPLIIAKIEKPEGVRNIDAILEAADGIMIARGDLGVEMPISQVPILQKRLIREAHIKDKLVITATQMLESMIQNPVPTRAEVSDVANAIFDGTDAVMLSAESAVGLYPVQSVKMLDRVARDTEYYLAAHRPKWDWHRDGEAHTLGEAIGNSAYWLYDDLNARAMIAYSATGKTALNISKSRPFAPIIVFTASREAARRMRLIWGVEPVFCADIHTAKDLRYYAAEYLRENAIVKGNDSVIIVSGSPFGVVDHTNSIEVMRLAGEVPVLELKQKRTKRTK